MIVKVSGTYTKKFTTSIRTNGNIPCCDLSLHISEICCDNDEPRKFVYKKDCITGCLIKEPCEKCGDIYLKYTAIDKDENGDYYFMFDKYFKDLPDKKYRGELYLCDKKVYNFIIDKRDDIHIGPMDISNVNICCSIKKNCSSC